MSGSTLADDLTTNALTPSATACSREPFRYGSVIWGQAEFCYILPFSICSAGILAVPSVPSPNSAIGHMGTDPMRSGGVLLYLIEPNTTAWKGRLATEGGADCGAALR